MTLTLLSAVAGVAAFGSTAFAQSGDLIVVDDDGGADYETIGAALANATAGDTIEVRDGTYEGAVVVDKDVTLQAENESGATIRHAPSSSTGQPAVKVTANGATVSGFVVERVAAGDRGAGAPFAQGIRISASDVVVSNNDVVGEDFGVGTNNAGVMVLDGESGGSGETVTNVTISGNAVSGFAGPISIAANYGGTISGVSVSGNAFSGNLADGVSVGAPAGTVSSLSLDGYEYNGTSDAHAGVTWYFKTETDALDYGANASGAVVEDSNGDYVVGPGMSIQDAVNASADGDTITVEPGTYTEQVVIDANVTLVGSGEGTTVIESPTTLAEKFTRSNGDEGYPVFLVRDADVDVRSLTVDGAGQGNDNHHFYGVVYRNASGTVANVTVSNVKESPMSGTQHGVAVALFNSDGEDRTVTLRDSTLVGYQKNGFVAAGENLTARVIGNDVTGAGPTDVIGQNGIQISGSAVGVIKDNVVGGHDYVNPGDPPVGTADIILYGHSNSETTVVSNNTVTDSEIGVAVAFSGNVEITGNEFANNLWHVFDYNTDSLDAEAIFEDNTYDTAAYPSNESGAVGRSVYGGIQMAIDAAETGDTVTVAPGTYEIPDGERLSIGTDGLTLSGAGEGETVIEAGARWGIYVSDTRNVTLEGFTVDGVDDGWGSATVKADFSENFTVQNVTTANGYIGFDLNNVRDASLTDVTATNNSALGTSLSGVENVTFDGLTTEGSPWGGVGIFTSDDTSAGWDNITVSDGVTITDHDSSGEPAPVYTQSATADDIGNLTLDDATHLVENPNHKPDSDSASDDYFAFYLHSESDAVAYATNDAAHADTNTTTVRTLDRNAEGVVSAGDTFVVEDGMSIQAAVDAAGEGATIDVGPGTYEESLSIGVENLTLSGPNAGVPAYSSQRGPEATVDANGSEFAIQIQEQSGNVTVDGFAVEGWTVGGIGQGMSDSEGTSAHVLNNDVDVTGQPVAHGNSIQVTGDHSTVVGNDVEVTGYDYDETDWATSGILAEGVNDTEIVDNRVEYVDTGDVGKYYRGITVEGVSSWDGPANDNVVRNNTVVGLSTGISIQMDASNTTVEDNTIVDSDVGLAVRMYQTRGENNLVAAVAPTAVTVERNSFDNNDVQVDDSEAVLDLDGVLAANEFDRAVTTTGGNAIWSNIQAGVDAAGIGDTVRVSAGTYDEDVTLAKNVTLVGPAATLDGRLDITADGATVDGLTITNSSLGGGLPTKKVDGILVSVQSDTGEWVTIQNVTIADLGNKNSPEAVEGIHLFGNHPTDGVLIDNVTIRDVSQPTSGADGIKVQGDVSNVTITDSTIENVSGRWSYGVVTTDSSSANGVPRHVTVVRTSFDDLTANEYMGVGVGVDGSSFGDELTVIDSRFTAVDAGVLNKDSGNATDATFNYWGASSGPSGDAPGDGVAVLGNAEYRPFLEDSAGNVNTDPITFHVDSGADASVANGSQKAPYATIDAALDAAMAGDTIFVQDGTYDRSSTLEIDTNGTTIVGESRENVVIDTSDVAGYGISTAQGENVVGLTVENLTVVGPQQGTSANYAFKFNPTTEGVALRNVSVVDSHRTGIDFNGVQYVTIENVTVSGTASGNGIAFTDTQYVTLDGVTVENNSWGGIALYTSTWAEEFGLENRTHNVTILNSTIRNNPGPGVYAQNSGGVDDPFADIGVFDNQFAGNPVHAAELDTSNGIKTSADWFDFDMVVGENDFDRAVTVRDGDFNVSVPAVFSSIQPAVDAAEDGDTVEAGPGTYEENVVIDTSIELHGAGAGQTVIAPGSGAAINVENVTNGNRIKVDDVAVGNLSIVAPDSSEIGLIAVSAAGDGDYETGNLTVANVVAEGGLASFGVFDTERATFHNVTVRDVESSVGAFEVGGVGDLAIIDSRIENTTTGVKFNDFTGLGYQPSESLVIVASTFDGNDVHLDVTAGIDAANVTLRESAFLNDGQSSGTAIAVDNDGDGAVDAARNYWGAPTGPGGVAPGAGATVSENVTYRPFYTNPALTENSSVPPQIGSVALTDTDGDGTVGNGDTVRVNATVTDASGVASVTVDARPFGGPENLALTDEDDDGVYEAEFTVSAAEANVDGDWSLSVVAADHGGATTAASTGALTLSTDSETRTSFAISDATPLNTEVVDVAVTVENVGQRSADRTITLLVDGTDVANRDVTVPAGQNRTVTFQRKFSTGTHAVTVNDSVYTLSTKTVVADRASNPNAGIEIDSPTAGQSFASGDVTVTYGLTNVDQGIAKVAYTVDDGPVQHVTNLSRTSVAPSGLADGSHTVDVWLVDNLGNDLSGDSVTFAVDSSAPVVTIDPARTDAVGANNPVEVNLTVEEDNPDEATFIVRDGGSEVYSEDLSDELADSSETVEWDGTDDDGDALATGEYELVLNATDEVGNADENATTVSVDNTPPALNSIDVNQTDLGSGETVTVNVTADDTTTGDSGVDAVDVTLTYDGGNYRTTEAATYVEDDDVWTARFDAADIDRDGTYGVTATATDSAGNSGSYSDSGNQVDVDTTAPTVSAIIDTKDASTGYVNVTVADDIDSAGDIGLNLTAPDGNDVSVSGLSQVAGTNTYSGTFSFTDGGEYTLEANATDAAGNLGEANATANISTGLTGTQFTIRGADGTVVVLNTTEDVTDEFAAFTSSNSALAELGASNVGETFLNGELSDGLTQNLENATIRIPATDENTPPGVDEANVTISRYNETTESWDQFEETELKTIGGTRYFAVTVDSFSTWGPVNPDTTAPSIDGTLLTPGGDGDQLPYSTSTVDVTVEYSDNKQVDASNVTVLWNGVDVTARADTSISTSEATFTATDLVGSGDHNVTVVVEDTAGNENSTEVLFTVEQDTAAPSVTLVEDTFDYGTDPVPLELTYSDDLSGVDSSSVELFVNGNDETGPAVVTSSGVEYEYDATGLGPGTYSVTLNVSDGEGNEEQFSGTFTIEGDGDEPTVTATTLSPTPTDGVLPLGTAQATISLNYRDDTSGIDTSAVEVKFDGRDVTDEAVITSGGLTYTALGLENGTSHTLVATIYDNEGNSWNETVAFEVAAPPSDGSDNRDRAVRARSSDRLSNFLSGGDVRLDVGGPVASMGIAFADSDASGQVSVQSLDERPASVAPIPDAAEIAFVDVTVPGDLTDSEATLELTVSADAVGDTDPENLVVYHYKDGEWTALETSVVSAGDESVVLEATTPGFSLFAVGASQEETTTPESTETPEPATDTPEPTATPAPETATPAPETATEEPVREPAGFGFGTTLVVLLVVGVLVAVYVLRIRRE